MNWVCFITVIKHFPVNKIKAIQLFEASAAGVNGYSESQFLLEKTK